MSTVQTKAAAKPLYIRLHADDNVAIVVNDFGLPAGSEFALRAEAARATCRRGTRWR